MSNWSVISTTKRARCPSGSHSSTDGGNKYEVSRSTNRKRAMIKSLVIVLRCYRNLLNYLQKVRQTPSGECCRNAINSFNLLGADSSLIIVAAPSAEACERESV